VRIIKESRLKEYMQEHPQAAPSLTAWMRETRLADWKTLADVRQSFRSADIAGNLTVFNIKGNDFRLITFIDYKKHLVFIRAFRTHAEYTKEDWKHDPWYRG